MTKYIWRENGPKPKIKADVFGKEIERIAGNSPVDAVKPEAIVEAARKRNSPIHKLFNWDNAVAADLHRRAQAGDYMRALQIVRVQVSSGPAVSSRAFFSVRQNQRLGYVDQDRVLSDRDLTAQVIATAKKELESYIQKYSGVLGLGNYIDRLQGVIDEMRDEVDRLELEATQRSPGKARSTESPAMVPA